jgi:hypothetical protein
MLTKATITLNSSELLLWTILRNFEALALKQYELYVPALVTSQKKELVDLLMSQVPSDIALDGTDLAAPVTNFLQSATGPDDVQTLIIQGLLLETLGQTIYQMFEENEVFSSDTRTMCSTGIAAGQSIKAEVSELIAKKFETDEKLFQAFVSSSRPVIGYLDALGQRLDKHFSERFNISFADLMGEYVAEIIPACGALGMDRRKVVSYLTSVLMGI